MKKLMCTLLALACVLGLTGCGGQSGGDVSQAPALWTVGDPGSILAAGACSEELEELDMDTAWMLFRLADYGLERDSLTDGAYFRSAGGTCEEVAVLYFDSVASAETARKALEAYVQSQIDANVDYRPADIPKLENAWLEQREATLLLAVVNDLDAAKSALS